MRFIFMAIPVVMALYLFTTMFPHSHLL